MRTVLVASVRTYARRYLAAGVAVVIAVGFVVTALGLASAARSGVRESVGQQYASADAVVTGASRGALSALGALADSGRVGAVSVNRLTSADFRTSNATGVVIGSVAADSGLRWQQLATGSYPEGRAEILLSEGFAEREGLEPGDDFSLQVGEVSRSLTVSGLAADAEGPLAAVAYLPEQAQTHLPATTVADVTVRAAADDAQALPAVLRNDLPPDATVHDAAAYVDDRIRELTGGIDALGQLLLVFAGISMFVGAMVIANTFTVLLAQRSREIALLRCVGGVRAQVVRGIAVEAAVLGTAAAVVGVACGVGGGRLAVGLLGEVAPDVVLGDPAPSVAALVVPFALGLVVTVGAALAPAVRATRVAPLAALQPAAEPTARGRAGAVRAGLGAAVGLAGLAGLVLGAAVGSLPLGMLGGFVSFLGVWLLAPLIVPAGIRLLGAPARALGVPGTLAVANVVRNSRRTAATAMALLIGTTLIAMIAVGAETTRTTSGALIDDEYPVDLTATSTDGLPAGAVGALEDVEGVTATAVLDGADAAVGPDGTRMLLVGVPAAAVAPVAHTTGAAPGADELVVSADTAASGVGSGDLPDRVEVRVGDRERTLDVIAGETYGASGLVSAATLEALGGSQRPAAVWMRVADGTDSSGLVAEVDGAVPGVEVQGAYVIRTLLDSVLDAVLAVVVGLLAVALLVALVGVGNTVSLSVLERTRESALLRALGLSRRQLRVSIAVESLLLAGVATLLGIALGVGYGWFGVRAALGTKYADSVTLDLPVVQLVAVVLVGALAACLASVLPARRAARVSPVAGLAAD